MVISLHSTALHFHHYIVDSLNCPLLNSVVQRLRHGDSGCITPLRVQAVCTRRAMRMTQDARRPQVKYGELLSLWTLWVQSDRADRADDVLYIDNLLVARTSLSLYSTGQAYNRLSTVGVRSAPFKEINIDYLSPIRTTVFKILSLLQSARLSVTLGSPSQSMRHSSHFLRLLEEWTKCFGCSRRNWQPLIMITTRAIGRQMKQNVQGTAFQDSYCVHENCVH